VISYKYKLLISYDGTRYCGWQMQPNGISIQSLIEEALKKLVREPVSLVGAGRTDAGVHALGQVAHFECAQKLDLYKTLASLNGILPLDIRIKSITEVAPSFHARFSAQKKIYHYHLWLESTMDPFFHQFRYHPRFKISIPLLEEACQIFVGKHDFATFANVNGGAKTSIRTIHRISVVPQEGGIRIEFEGDGFLYKMVRNLVGTLLEVASGKKTFPELQNLLLAKDRRLAGMAAPAKGLFLVRVFYPEI